MTWSLAAYATYAEYAQRNGRTGTADQSSIETMLTTISRVVDGRCGVFDGMFAPQTSTEFVFAGYGGTILRLRDEAGLQYLLRTPTADKIEVDDGDGTYTEYTLDFSDAWVRGYPSNNSTRGRPYTAIELLPHVDDADPTAWPKSITAVKVTGTWGYEATPGGIKERVISMTRELIDSHHAGVAMSVEMLDGAIQANRSARTLMQMIEGEFNYRIPVL